MTKTGNTEQNSCYALLPCRLAGTDSLSKPNFPGIHTELIILHALVVGTYTLTLLTAQLIVFVPFSFKAICHFYQKPKGGEPLQTLLKRGSCVQPASPQRSMRGSGQQVGRPWVVASLSSCFQTPDSLLGGACCKESLAA